MRLTEARRATKVIVSVVDAALALAVAVAAMLRVAALAVRRPRRTVGGRPGLLVLDSAYALSTVRARGLEHSLVSRDLDGFFGQVWHVHPLVGADPDESPDAAGPPVVTELVPGHTVVEGHVHAFRRVRALPLLDFALGQARLLSVLVRIVADGTASVIRVGDPYYLGLLGLALSRAGGIPLVVRVNGNYDAIYRSVGRLAYPRLFRTRKVEKLVDRFVLRRADLVAGANEDNLRFALDNGARPERSTVFRYGNLIDPSHFTEPHTRGDVRAELGLPDGAPFLVCVGRLEPVKLPEDVLETLVRARVLFPGLHAVYVGDGNQRETLQQRATELGVAEHVHFAGARPQAWIARALAAASVVVAPNAGRALVEAFWSATPVVTYDVDWHAELVEDGATGLLVPPRDVATMADCVVRLLGDEAFAEELGRRARDRARETMSPDLLLAHERASYEQVLERARERWRSDA